MKKVLFGAALALAATAAAHAGEFNNECAYGMSLGKHVKTDCSVNAQIDGKTYCFSSDNAKSKFMQDEKANMKKAQEFAAKDNKK